MFDGIQTDHCVKAGVSQRIGQHAGIEQPHLCPDGVDDRLIGPTRDRAALVQPMGIGLAAQFQPVHVAVAAVGGTAPQMVGIIGANRAVALAGQDLQYGPMGGRHFQHFLRGGIVGHQFGQMLQQDRPSPPDIGKA